MSEHPIQGLMDTTLQKIREMVDVNTIIGDQIVAPDGTVIIPVSKVSVGFGSGGSDLPNKSDRQLFGGGGGAGVSIVPVAFIVVSGGNVKLLQIKASTSVADNAIALVPELVDKISSLFGSKDKKKSGKSADAADAAAAAAAADEAGAADAAPQDGKE
jgi:sporulation protein YtfJ